MSARGAGFARTLCTGALLDGVFRLIIRRPLDAGCSLACGRSAAGAAVGMAEVETIPLVSLNEPSVAPRFPLAVIPPVR